MLKTDDVEDSVYDITYEWGFKPWGEWGDELYCDTIFLIHGDKSIKSPFGLTVHYDYEEAA